jgi:Flp pilus assembly protein TadD
MGNKVAGYWICAGLLVSVLIVYGPTLGHDFINYDDFEYVVHNSRVRGGLTWPGIQWTFTSTHASNWHPLTWLSHMLDVQLFGLKPAGHHFTNLLLHALNTMLLFLLLRTMTGAMWRSAIAAALFALHPLHVESVAWVAERKDLLSTFFLFLTLQAYAGYAKQPGLKKYLSVMGLFVLGLMAKPMLVTLPFVLLLLDYWPLNRLDMDGTSREQRISVFTRLVREKIPLFLLSALSSAMTLFAQTGAIWNLAEIPLPARLGNALISYVKYLWLTLWPMNLAVIYPYPASIKGSEILLALAVLIIISAGVFLAAKKHRYLPVGWLWYLGTLVPVIGIVQVGSQAMADRYTYIPLIGIFILLVWGGHDLFVRLKWNARAAELTAAGLIVLLMLLSLRQVGYWKDGATLFRHTIGVTAENHIAHNNLGIALAHQGKKDGAAVHFREALRISPAYADALYNLALHCQKEGKVDEAIVHYRQLIRVRPSPDAMNNLAVALMSRGRFDEAAGQLLKILQEDPGNARASNNYGVILLQRGDADSAGKFFERALRLDPGYENARSNLELATKAKKRP